MNTECDTLPTEVRARTILAGCDRVDMTIVGDVTSDVTSSGHVGVLLDWRGSAYLVITPEGCAPEGRLRVTCRSRTARLGVLRLEGTCGLPLHLPDHPGILHLLEMHRPAPQCGHHDWRSMEPSELTVVPLHLDGVRLLVPATATDRARGIDIDVTAYLAASPDIWALDTSATRDQLEHDLQPELCLLAAAQLDRDEEAPPFSVAIAALGPRQIDLACLSIDGVTTLAIPYGRRIEHPSYVRQWIGQAARYAG